MKTYTLQLAARTTEKPEDLRAEGSVPAVVYGPGVPATSVSVAIREFERLYKEAGTSSLIDVVIPGGSAVKVLVQDVQYSPATRAVIHVDLRTIDMTKEMQVEVVLHYVGEAPAVKSLGGTMMKMVETLSVTCLPQNLVSHIDVDVTTLNTFDDAIHVKDIALPEGIRVSDDVEMVVAKVVPPFTEEQLKKMEESGSVEVDLTKIAVEEKGKKEEEAAEGEEKAVE